MELLNPGNIASQFLEEIKQEITDSELTINITGFLATGNPASAVYAEYTKKSCQDVGINFELNTVTPDLIEERIKSANQNENIHGVFVYYPISNPDEDQKIKELVDPRKDVEGLTDYWSNKLYADQRFDDVARRHKCILPCTPLAILKILGETPIYSDQGLPFQDQVITIFNRSDVIGKPLAHMLVHDGAKVFSFDVDGGVEILKNGYFGEAVERSQVLKRSNVVITGVPVKSFEKIKAEELVDGTVCLNFSTIPNFEEDAKTAASIYIPRVGPLTVAMCLRNALRLYKNYHADGERLGD